MAREAVSTIRPRPSNRSSRANALSPLAPLAKAPLWQQSSTTTWLRARLSSSCSLSQSARTAVADTLSLGVDRRVVQPPTVIQDTVAGQVDEDQIAWCRATAELHYGALQLV